MSRVIFDKKTGIEQYLTSERQAGRAKGRRSANRAGIKQARTGIKQVKTTKDTPEHTHGQ
jgi:hypothetical protein